LGSFLLLHYWKKEKYADFVRIYGRGYILKKKDVHFEREIEMMLKE